jgi:arylformamidase
MQPEVPASAPVPMPAPDVDAREREYSPSSMIGGNYGPFIDRYRAESDAALRALPVQRDLAYGTSLRERLDYFPAPAGAVRPGLLVFIHGGYWQELSKAESAFLAPAWHAAGVAHAVVDYTLAPAASVAQIVEECVAAIAWLHARATDLGFAADAMVIAGSSAGAYLAAACAARGATPLRGIVPVSGVYDLSPLIGTSINDALGLDQASAATLNLLDGRRRFCPAVVAWGEIETAAFKQQSQRFAMAVAAGGAPCTTFEVPGRNHFDVIHELGTPGARLFDEARALLAPA